MKMAHAICPHGGLKKRLRKKRVSIGTLPYQITRYCEKKKYIHMTHMAKVSLAMSWIPDGAICVTPASVGPDGEEGHQPEARDRARSRRSSHRAGRCTRSGRATSGDRSPTATAPPCTASRGWWRACCGGRRPRACRLRRVLGEHRLGKGAGDPVQGEAPQGDPQRHERHVEPRHLLRERMSHPRIEGRSGRRRG